MKTYKESILRTIRLHPLAW